MNQFSVLGAGSMKRSGRETKTRGKGLTDTKTRVGPRGSTNLLLLRPLPSLKCAGTHVHDVVNVKQTRVVCALT